MKFNVKNVYPQFDFEIVGASYAGQPRNNTVMYISKKVEYLVDNLRGLHNCLCFLEYGIDVPTDIKEINGCVFVDNPQYEYAKFAEIFMRSIQVEEAKKGYSLTDGGYYVGDNVQIGANAYIEPGVLIGHNVIIGNNTIILAGAKIKHAIIGDNFLCNENAVIGDYSFTMAEDEMGNRMRIPSMGRVIIGNNVEVGACNDVAQGTCGDTVLEDYVKLDALVHIGHEAHLGKNTEITAGAIIGGFVKMEEHSYLGINSSIRNRIQLGADCVIGMGAVVTKSVDEDTTMIGNPAKIFVKKNR